MNMENYKVETFDPYTGDIKQKEFTDISAARNYAKEISKSDPCNYHFVIHPKNEATSLCVREEFVDGKYFATDEAYV